jgi:hypothetical protein
MAYYRDLLDAFRQLATQMGQILSGQTRRNALPATDQFPPIDQYESGAENCGGAAADIARQRRRSDRMMSLSLCCISSVLALLRPAEGYCECLFIGKTGIHRRTLRTALLIRSRPDRLVSYNLRFKPSVGSALKL